MRGSAHRHRRDLVAALMTMAAVSLGLGVIGAAPAPAMAQAGAPTASDAELPVIDWIGGPANLLLTDEEMRTAQTVEPAAREAFREWFWGRRDPRPETPRNEFRDEFYRRVAYADNAFGDPSAAKPGWKTARGLCWVILGAPDSRAEGSVRIPSEGGAHRAESWRYVGRSERLRERDLHITFALVRGHDVVVSGPGGRELRHLQDVLSAAASAAIRNEDWAFEAPRAVELDGRALPVDANVWVGDTARDVELSFSVTDLYGELVDGKLMVRLELGIVEAGPRAAAASPRRVRDAMDLELALDPEEASTWSEQPLQVLIRLPLDGARSRYAGVLQVVERTTGRRALVPLAAAASSPGRQPMPDRYPVGRLLAIGKGRPEGSVAIAFFAPASDADPARTLWLSRAGSAPPDDKGLALPGGEIRLVRVAGQNNQ